MQPTSPPTGGQTSRPPGPGGPWALDRDPSLGARIAVIAGLVALAVLVLLGGLSLARLGHPLPGTHVAGTDVSGLGAKDLRAAVDGLVRARQETTVDVTAAGESFRFTPGADGYGGDVDATIDAALEAGRDGPLGWFGQVAATFGSQREVELQGAPIELAIASFVDEVVATVDQELSVGSVRVDPETLEVQAEPPRAEVVVDVEASIEALTAVIGDPDPPPVELPAQVTAPPTDQAALEDAIRGAERAVADHLVLTANDATAVLEPSEIATVLRTRERDGALVLVADQDALADALAPDLPALEVQPTDATFEVVSEELPTLDEQGAVTWRPRPAELRVVPSRVGYLYDPEVGAQQVGRLLDEGVREAELELPLTLADLTTDDAESLGVDQLLGTFTTHHACCANRVTNIHRIADIVRGNVLRPGETFSINDFVGERTRAKGFVADGAIFQGEIRDEIGGGISQFATTMYNASFFAGIPIIEHRAHSLYISRYPLGREATLSFPSIDLEIENDTDHGMFIHTSYTDTSITVSLFGDNGGREVTATTGEPYNHRGFDTHRRPTSSLPRGRERVIQSGAQGYQVAIERIIRGGGMDRTEQIVTTYKPRPRIVEVGTGEPPDSPPPEPEPSPTASEPEPTPSDSSPD